MRHVLIDEMKGVFGADQKRVDHALAVLGYAERIQAAEAGEGGDGGDPAVVIAAAILHDIGIHQAQRKHGSSAGKYQEIEGPGIARRILLNYGLNEDIIDHVCGIVGNHHSAKGIDTLEFRIVWDADWIVNIPDEFDVNDGEETRRLIGRVFKTNSGREIAEKLFLMA